MTFFLSAFSFCCYASWSSCLYLFYVLTCCWSDSCLEQASFLFLHLVVLCILSSFCLYRLPVHLFSVLLPLYIVTPPLVGVLRQYPSPSLPRIFLKPARKSNPPQSLWLLTLLW
uniref:Uncharacterized protein n=1 Tax=Opuntia streptacantha TaxID=393608 RepID=A0A7C8ZHW4_OPUST